MNKFQITLGLSALFIAGCAAFFSVFGIGKLFSGAFLSVVIMASSLELGKLVTASFLYRYWDKINLLQKIYMAAATIMLIFITSAGIFGYLSNAYQGATVEFEKQTTALLFKEEQVEQLEEDKQFLLNELDQQVQSLPDNYITAKRKLREDYNPQILSINSELLDLKKDVGELKITFVDHEGSGKSFDTIYAKKILEYSDRPIIFEGGFGNIQHIDDAIKIGVDSIALGFMLNYRDNNIFKIKQYLENKGHSVRLRK